MIKNLQERQILLQKQIYKGSKIPIGEQYFPYKVKSNENALL